jgi:glycosyltransferase involved in cell wall biosynthesis
MSVYHKVPPEQLALSLASLAWQTRPADQIVIVMDGPIPDALGRQLDAFQRRHSAVELVPLKQNIGLSAALNAGIEFCHGDWLIRMDADDLSLPNRFAQQIAYIEAHPEVDVLGTALYEFSGNYRQPERVKPVITEHQDIAASIGLRNPMNHPTVFLRKQALINAGGYPSLSLLEDYYLWGKLLGAGATFHNLAEPLYLFRFDAGTLTRRRGLDNFKNETWLRQWLHKQGLIPGHTRFLANTLQLLLRFSPSTVQNWLWQRSRQPCNTSLQLPELPDQ